VHVQRAYFAAAVISACLLAPVAAAPDEQPIAVTVTPGSCVAPCSVRLAVRVAPAEANRSVTIAAESSDFYRRSTRPLEGSDAPRLHELRLNEIPAGLYEVTITVDRANKPPQRYAARFVVGPF
jgi:hypothetical protein